MLEYKKLENRKGEYISGLCDASNRLLFIVELKCQHHRNHCVLSQAFTLIESSLQSGLVVSLRCGFLMCPPSQAELHPQSPLWCFWLGWATGESFHARFEGRSEVAAICSYTPRLVVDLRTHPIAPGGPWTCTCSTFPWLFLQLPLLLGQVCA